MTIGAVIYHYWQSGKDHNLHRQPSLQAPRGGGRGSTWVFFGWVCAARDSKLAPRSKKKIPLKLIPRSRVRPKLIPRSRNGPIFYTLF